MRTLTLIRSSSAAWAAPVVLLLMLTYYFTDIQSDLPPDPMGYAPTIVDAVLRNLIPVAYAVAASLAAWEARKLGRSGVWQSGAVRSRYAIAAHSLLPVLAASWLVLVLPTLCALGQTGVAPNLSALGLVGYAMLMCAAHAVLGFAAGVRVRHIAVVPIVGIIDFLVVGWAAGLKVPWPRHLTGLYTAGLMFGELPTWSSLIAPMLLACGVATAVVLLWSGIRHRWLKGVLASGLALVSISVPYVMVNDWDYIARRSTGHGAMSCTGEAPRICMPSVHAEALPEVREVTESTLQKLAEAGVEADPTSITDRAALGRFPDPASASAWQIPLAAGEAAGTLRYRIARATVRFPCTPPETQAARTVYYWASVKAGVGDTYIHRLKTEPDFTSEKRKELLSRAGAVFDMKAEDEVNWLRRTVASACERSA